MYFVCWFHVNHTINNEFNRLKCVLLVSCQSHHCRGLLNCETWAQILEEDAPLFFHLQQQSLIELIRLGKIEEALEFAQEYLAPKGEENPEFLEDLGALKHESIANNDFAIKLNQTFVGYSDPLKYIFTVLPR